MDESDMIDFMKDMNDGFASIRLAMSDGFTVSNDKIAHLAETVAKMSGRFDGIVNKQTELDKKMDELEEMKGEVEKNTTFRKNMQKINWEIAKPIIYIVVIAIVTIIASSIFQNGAG